LEEFRAFQFIELVFDILRDVILMTLGEMVKNAILPKYFKVMLLGRTILALLFVFISKRIIISISFCSSLNCMGEVVPNQSGKWSNPK
jgi:hypothetical protein